MGGPQRAGTAPRRRAGGRCGGPGDGAADHDLPPPEPGPGRTVTRRAESPDHDDPRLPASGSAIVREYKGRTIRVVVSPRGEGFEWDGRRFRTLSAVAKEVTGSHINGFRFFRLESKP